MINANLTLWIKIKVIILNKWIIPGLFILTLTFGVIISEISDIIDYNSKFDHEKSNVTNGLIDSVSIMGNAINNRVKYFYSYQINGREFSGYTNFSGLEIKAGERVLIEYNIQKPNISRVKGTTRE